MSALTVFVYILALHFAHYKKGSPFENASQTVNGYVNGINLAQ